MAEQWTYDLVPKRIASWESKYRVVVRRNGRLVETSFAETKWGARRQARAIQRNWLSNQRATVTTHTLPSEGVSQ